MRNRALEVLRWCVSISFFFMAMTKVTLVVTHGLEPYREVVVLAGLPEVIKYYGVFAVAIEFYLAIGVWIKQIFHSALILMMMLTVCGTALSIVFIIFKLNMDCGCGLLGDSEYGLLVQKIVILGVLGILYKNETRLFAH
mgnify:CR=1 FL=1